MSREEMWKCGNVKMWKWDKGVGEILEKWDEGSVRGLPLP